MNVAVIIAGGVGSRFGANIPKQFVEVNGKPIIEYTLKVFQNAKFINKIVVVCISGWIDYISNIKEKCDLTKLTGIIVGGETRFYSILKGITFLEPELESDDIVILHDAVRPCVTCEMLKQSISVASKFGASLSVAPCFDTMFVSNTGLSVDKVYPREKLFKGQTPESMKYGVAFKSYKYAEKKGIYIDSPTALLMQLGVPVGLAIGNQSNIKITTPEDIDIFRTILENSRYL